MLHNDRKFVLHIVGLLCGCTSLPTATRRSDSLRCISKVEEARGSCQQSQATAALVPQLGPGFEARDGQEVPDTTQQGMSPGRRLCGFGEASVTKIGGSRAMVSKTGGTKIKENHQNITAKATSEFTKA